MKKITIPECSNPFVVILNDVRYEYESGREVEVPEDVAKIIERHDKHKAKPIPEGGGDGDGSYDEGYNDGFEAGKNEGGGGLYDAEINALLAVAPFLTKAYVEWSDDEGFARYGGAIHLKSYGGDQCIIFPPWITEVARDFSEFYTVDVDTCTAIFLSKTPPTIGWQGSWSSGGGSRYPRAIFVPDESIDAYKAATNLAEFSDRIKPLSQYNGEGYTF